MLAAALRAEIAAYVEQFADQVDDNGHRLVVRKRYHDEREVLTAAGAVAVRAPRVNDKRVDPETGQRQRVSSAILPAWCRKRRQVTEVLPLLYLHGLSSGDFGPALEQFPGHRRGPVGFGDPSEARSSPWVVGPRSPKGPGGRAAGIAMADQLIEAAPGPLAVRQRPTPGRPRRRRRRLRQAARRTTRQREGGLSLRSATAGGCRHRRVSRTTGYSRSELRWYFA
jgi:hypothetical protein